MFATAPNLALRRSAGPFGRLQLSKLYT